LGIINAHLPEIVATIQRIKGNWLYLGFAAILLLPTPSVRGAAFDLPDQDAFVIGRGMAFVATADNPSAIYYNPAGICQSEGNNFRAGVYGIYIDPMYTPPGSSQTFHNQDKVQAIPQFYYTYGREEFPVHFGLGVYAPFGLSENWPQGTGFRTVAIKASLNYITVNPVIAFKVAPELSFGGGITINHAEFDLQQGLTPVPNNDLVRFTGDGWAVGYNLGVLWQPDEKVSIGASFRSSTKVNLDGQTETWMHSVQPQRYSAASADFPFPLKAIFGISYRPTPDWNLEFNADYTDWDMLGTVTVHQKNPPPILPLANVPLTLNWQSSWYYEFGATRYLGNGWRVSAGYIFNENSVPDAHYTPLVADLDRHFFSLGAGYKAERFEVDVAYQFGYGPSRVVTGSAGGAPGPADGTYDFISHALAVSVGVHF
jgi:long-chain fatty acid transport protein